MEPMESKKQNLPDTDSLIESMGISKEKNAELAGLLADLMFNCPRKSQILKALAEKLTTYEAVYTAFRYGIISTKFDPEDLM